MSKFTTYKTNFLARHSWQWLATCLLSFSLSLGMASVAKAENPDTAPRQLREMIEQMETAANEQDLDKLTELYSPQFTNSDGLNYQNLPQALEKFWQNHSRLKYTTELKSWTTEGDELVAETVTIIQGTARRKAKLMFLDTKMRSRQYFRNQKLIRQEILSEETQVISGPNPPQVVVNLPEQVSVGEQFSFDVIVQEPLGEDLLLGAAMEEGVSSSQYLNPGEFDLELLPAGGIFKLARVSDASQDHWYSAILVRGDGITVVSQRVKVKASP